MQILYIYSIYIIIFDQITKKDSLVVFLLTVCKWYNNLVSKQKKILKKGYL